MSTTGQGGRGRRETRSLNEMSTSRFTREPSTNPLVPSITRYTHDIPRPGCSPHPLQSCVQAGWSENTTRTPNRLSLWSESNQLQQIYSTLMKDVDMTSQHGVELHRVICSLLVPSCEDGLLGRNLPCRSACVHFMHTLKESIDTEALGALCNTSLPESESGSVCFRIHGQNSGRCFCIISALWMECWQWVHTADLMGLYETLTSLQASSACLKLHTKRKCCQSNWQIQTILEPIVSKRP